jgi:hypothetical protein
MCWEVILFNLIHILEVKILRFQQAVGKVVDYEVARRQKKRTKILITEEKE